MPVRVVLEGLCHQVVQGNRDHPAPIKLNMAYVDHAGTDKLALN